MLAVINSSPLIFLALLNKIDILPQIFDEIILPTEVYKEISVEGHNFNIIKQIEKNNFQIKSAMNTALFEFLSEYLDKGEAEVITISKELNSDYAIIDELRGRKLARRHSVKIIGTLGILLSAKQIGLISEIKSSIMELENNKIWLGQKLINDVLIKAKEY